MAALCLSQLLLVSCAKSYPWVGHFVGNRNLEVRPGTSKVLAYTIGKIDLDLKPDGTFELLDAAVPKGGRYRTVGDKAYLRIDRIMERPVEDLGESAVQMNVEVELVAKSDTAITFFDPKGFDTKPIELRRQK